VTRTLRVNARGPVSGMLSSAAISRRNAILMGPGKAGVDRLGGTGIYADTFVVLADAEPTNVKRRADVLDE
jgi:hypothetical protein